MKRNFLASGCFAVLLIAPWPALAQQEQGGDRAVQVEPYIELSQVVLAELSPGDDLVTYTQIATGVDLVVQGRNNGGSASLRYERNIAYGDDASDTDTVTGIARGYASIVPQVLTVEAGALASNTRIEGNGGTSISPLDAGDSESTIYSAYAGPNVHTRVGDVEVNANYRLGYTRVESPDAIITAPGAAPVDVFDDSVTSSANIHMATRPGEPLPVGVGVGAGYFQEDISNLDQRVRDAHVRGDVTVPLSPGFALVGGVGYEDVEISSRDALRDAAGNPVVGSDGRLVTDESAPRQIAYETSGLIWDVGALWRPSTRTALEAHVGRRYDSTTYYGSFAWAPSSRSALNISVYDGVTGFGGQLTNALAQLPTQFTASRNGITGDLNGCVSSLEGGNCLTGVLGSVRSATFRGRGIAASYQRQFGATNAGIGIGYDRRKFVGAAGTVLAAANGLLDETYYATLFLDGELGRNAGFSANTYASWFESDFTDAGALALGASAAYRRNITRSLSARAALAYDHLDSEIASEDLTAASALVGLRYDF